MDNMVSIVLGGGRGQRLYPLTAKRAKPAVPFGGKYRLVDIPISNCIYAGLRQIYILTQFNSASLHRHIANTYRFDTFNKGFVEVLAAEQTPQHMDWYQGTADAVRKNMSHFEDQLPRNFLILSGDQLYRMDFVDMFQAHVESGSDVTIAAIPVPREQVSGLGILQVDPTSRITQFVEKPGPDLDISTLRMPPEVARRAEVEVEGEAYLASMGIYIFTAPALRAALDNTLADFGSEIIPASIEGLKVSAYLFDGYWEDIGTIKSFYEANIDLASINPDFNLYLEKVPIFTNRRDLPAVEDQLQHHRREPRGRGLHHHQREHLALHRRHPDHHRDRRQPRRGHLHGRGLLRDRRAEGAERGAPASPTWASAAAASSSRPSSTRTRASATTAGSASTRCRAPTWTCPATPSATASSRSPRERCSPRAP